MNIVFFAHPTFLAHQSMPRFARMLSEGMSKRGHNTEIWSPNPSYINLASRPFIRKWLGYIDQYSVFPGEVRRKLVHASADTLYVFTDQALGPWVPLVADRAHVIHCHDFMALRSALGEIPENPVGFSGNLYQNMIRKGFSKGKHFISVSNKTRDDLDKYLLGKASTSEVVYNGFHQPFFPYDKTDARSSLGKRVSITLSNGYLLHVGGNLWYKNRPGVIDIYDAWRESSTTILPLLMIGERPDPASLERQKSSPYGSDIHWLSDVEDEFVRLAYSGASAFIFPSKAEGFGWPIAEAMASGCPVVTTNEPPMTEVAGDAAFLIANCPKDRTSASYREWAASSAGTVSKLLELSSDELQSVIRNGLENAKRFDTDHALEQIENIYFKIIKQFSA